MELNLIFSKYGDKLLVGKSLVNILKYACWRIKVYGNRIKVYKISQTQIFIPLIFFLVKKRVKKEYDVDEYLSLGWDCLKVCQAALFITHKRFLFCYNETALQ